MNGLLYPHLYLIYIWKHIYIKKILHIYKSTDGETR